MMTREKVVFEANTPVVCVMEHDEGKLTPSKYGYDDQYMYTLDGDRIAWVPPLVEARRKSLGIKKGEAFAITRVTKGRQNIDWKVERVGTAAAPPVAPAEPPSKIETQLRESIALVGMRKAQPEPAAPIATSGAVRSPAAPAPAPQAINDQRPRSLIASAMVAAIDALAIAREYAAAKGVQMEIRTEDVRCVASTLYIQHYRQAAS